MDNVDFGIIFSTILLPVNLFCSFWFLKEGFYMAGITFGEFLQHFSQSAPQSNRRRTGLLMNYLVQKGADPEKIRKLLRWYAWSTLPGLAAVLLAEYGAFSTNANKAKILLAGNLILILINAAIFWSGKIYRKNHPLDEKTTELLEAKRSKSTIQNRVVFTVVAVFFLVILAGFPLAAKGAREQIRPQLPQIQAISNGQQINFQDVHTVLYENGFETANIPTTYWEFDEEKLRNVSAGSKGDTKFEYYEYSDGETTGEVYHSIIKELLTAEGEYTKSETEISGGGMLCRITQNGVDRFVLYRDHTVIYAHSPQNFGEINDILKILGYLS